MAIENFNEIVEYMNTNKESEEVKGYLGGFKQEPTLDVFKSKITSDETFKSYVNSLNEESVGTWKTNNLQKLIDEAKTNPKETAEQKQIRELTERLNKKEGDEKKQILTNTALKLATEKKLPIDLLDYFVGNDEASTISNLSKLETSFQTFINSAVEERMKQGSHTPPTNNNPNTNNNNTSNSFIDIIKENQSKR